MRSISAFALIFCSFLCAQGDAPPPPTTPIPTPTPTSQPDAANPEVTPIDDAEASISSKDILAHLNVLAADEMKGRMTGSPECEKAAEYIQAHMVACGLKPAGEDKGFLAKFAVPNRVSANVCGVVPGKDPALKKEYIVLGAHYDHVGIGAFGSRAPQRRGEVHNGADDNASGSSGLLELMQAFGNAPTKRSILFLAFSGEEMGLLGSAAWVKKPTIPIKSITSMINLDMIGRSKDRYVFVGGLNSSPGFLDLFKKTSAPFPFNYELNGGGRGPSDHQSFYNADIPVMFFFTAEHGEYHTPDDDIALINTGDQALIVRLAYRLARTLGDTTARPKFARDDRDAMPTTSDRKVDQAMLYLGATLGVVGEPEDGVPVSDVKKGTPGAKAGLQAGDALLSIDGEKLPTAKAVQLVLALRRPGSLLKVQIKRGKKILNLKVQTE